MRQIPMTFKRLYTAFMLVLIPYYWREYTPWNFLYFCDAALILTFIGVWTENALLVSMAAARRDRAAPDLLFHRTGRSGGEQRSRQRQLRLRHERRGAADDDGAARLAGAAHRRQRHAVQIPTHFALHTIDDRCRPRSFV